MDKRTVGAFLLIGLVFLTWSLFFAPAPPPADQTSDTNRVAVNDAPAPNNADSTPVDTTGTSQTDGDPETGGDTADTTDLPVSNDPFDRYRGGASETIVVSTPLYRATISSSGALLSRFELTGYDAWYGDPVQLIRPDSARGGGELGVRLLDGSGEIATHDFSFELSETGTIDVGTGDSLVVIARLRSTAPDTTGDAASTGGIQLTKRFVFRADEYDIDLAVEAPEYDRVAIDWTGGLHYQEYDSRDESNEARAYVMIDDELESFNAEVDEPLAPKRFEGTTGTIEWVGTKSKYFAAALVPMTSQGAIASVSGTAAPADSNGLVESYDFSLDVPTTSAATGFTLFLGPLEYELAQEHDMTGMVDYGFLEFMVRPIAEYLLLPIFRFLHGFISNWGLVIIVFSVLIRLALWPLSIPQIKSSEKMRLVQPLMNEVREKHKDDQQKAQMETMKLYREYGVNPAGGCLPLLLQLPILYALWTTLSNAIDLRQADFALWITDLSRPDVLFELPFSLPLIGDQMSGLALIMGITLFIQQKLMITDPKQKMIVYIMPVLLTIAFNYFPSGLNLYYLVYNLLSIFQHYYMRNIAKSTLTLDELKNAAKNKKKGWLSTKLEEAQKMAEMQQQAGGGRSGGGRRR